MLRRSNRKGFTLIELILVVVIMGILATVAFRSGASVYNSAKSEQTKQELDALAYAIAGNPDLQNNGIRSDFGYVGDVGAVPPDLDALVSNPGGFATWAGPYVSNRFTQIADDYKKDAWGDDYVYTPGVLIESTGKTVSGGGCGGPTTSGDIVRRVASSNGDLLRNEVSGIVLDLDGTPPGTKRDSISVFMTYPSGSGGWRTEVSTVDGGGYFVFDSIPIGNHDLGIIKLPEADTMTRYVSVLPGSSLYQEYHLAIDAWYGTGNIPSLAGHYTLDEGSGQTAFDGSGQSVDLTLQNDAPGAGWDTGKIGGAFAFDGVDDHFDIATDSTELQMTGDYSASVWIYADSDQVVWAAIFSKCTPTGNDNHWTLQWDNSSGTTKRMTLYHPSGNNWRSNYRLIDAQNAWHHIAVTYRSSPARVQLYVDGAFHSESTSLTAGPGTGSGRFRIGCDRTGYTWRGKMDDLRIYRQVLSSSDVQALYDMGAP
ncbi:MAG: prepilin-type N-terminal cleavage/methylation domain-containing protein [bacterium]|nr:prepilin-type N-terminal cleavage/methylation domain-containing protein [bacterium]